MNFWSFWWHAATLFDDASYLAEPSELRHTSTIFLGDYSNNYVSAWRVL
jgi:hypothetical protein